MLFPGLVLTETVGLVLIVTETVFETAVQPDSVTATV